MVVLDTGETYRATSISSTQFFSQSILTKKMSAIGFLKLSFCIAILNLLASSQAAMFTCREACDAPNDAVDIRACVEKCRESLAQNREFYLDSLLERVDGRLLSELLEPHVDLLGNRVTRRASLLTNNFVRYGRNDPNAVRKAAQRRPQYIRVGRSGELGGDFETTPFFGRSEDIEVDAKRSSPFVRIGKSEEELASSVYDQADKRNLPSKYVRIGKRDGDATSGQ